MQAAAVVELDCSASATPRTPAMTRRRGEARCRGATPGTGRGHPRRKKSGRRNRPLIIGAGNGAYDDTKKPFAPSPSVREND